jgi:hypothetical protein
MATLDDVRRIAMPLPRTTEHLIRDHVKFRVGRLVYASVSPDEERLGFGFPKEEREALVASRPEVFMMPLPGDMRYQWVRARLPALDEEELRELLIDAWCMVMPKTIAAAYLDSQGITRGRLGRCRARLISMCTCPPRTGSTAAWPGTWRRPRPTSARPRSGRRSASWPRCKAGSR